MDNLIDWTPFLVNTQESVYFPLRPCSIQLKNQNFSRFPVTSNLAHMHETLNMDENKN